MPRRKIDLDNGWGIMSHLRKETRPYEVKDRREFHGFVMSWERERAPSFEKLKKITEEYIRKNSRTFEYYGSDVIKKEFQAFEAICTGYAGYYFHYGFWDVETKILLARYDNQNGIFIKFFEHWRIKSGFPF